MFNHEAEVRAFTLGDLPLIQRLKSRGISLDSEGYLSRGLHTISDATLSQLPLGDLGAPTVVVRQGQEHAFGQLRHDPVAPDAHIVFIAPRLPEDFTHLQEGTWLALLDGLGQLAGLRGAQNIHAEVDENSVVFEALRHAGYASYTRQDIWRRPPSPLPAPRDGVILRPARADDLPAIRYLHAQTVPRLAQTADPAPGSSGVVAVCGGAIRGFVAVSAGGRGVYLKPYLHADEGAHAAAVLAGTLWQAPHTNSLPVYCCVRQYQAWLSGPLEELGFVPWARQTVLVKHTAARVERPAFATLSSIQGGITIQGGRTGRC